MARGGVEDTRLKAKDTKKIRGQGQPFQGQTLSRPRTGMLEAKDPSASALQKKKGLHKNFLGDLKKKKKSLHKSQVFRFGYRPEATYCTATSWQSNSLIFKNYAFCNVTKLQNAELPMVRSEMD